MPCNEEKLKVHIAKGNIKLLKENVDRQKKFLEKPQFDDSFKVIFGIKSYNEKKVKEAKKINKYRVY
ncbi:hypothetical protein HYV89_01915 [Candidatus Woesearchaeota archaeon]|nr:hypothetical protein [Candidatus Woesearchaeota archaeon]